MIVNIAETSGALNYGVIPDVKAWVKAGAKDIIKYLQVGVQSAKAFLGKVKNWVAKGWEEAKKAGKNIGAWFESIKGKFAQAMVPLLQVGVVAGVIAGIALTGVLLVGSGAVSAAVAWVVGSIGSLSVILGGMQMAGVNVGGMIRGTLNAAEFVYRFNWQESDKQIQAEIEQLITSLYEPAGEFLGRSIAGLLVGGFASPPKIRVNVRQIALLWQLNPDIRDELLQNVSSFCYAALTVAKTIGFKTLFMKGRAFIKDFHKNNALFRKFLDLIPGNFNNKISTWGDEGQKPWSIAGYVEEKVESIESERIKQAVEGFLEGFWDGFRESVEYVYV